MHQSRWSALSTCRSARLSHRAPNPFLDDLSGLVRIVVFPDPNDVPSEARKSRVRVTVAPLVTRNLLRPVPRVVAEPLRAVMFAAMPETPVDEHRDARSREDKVRSTSQFRLGAPIHEVSKAKPMHGTAESELRSSPRPPLGPHALAYLLARRE